MRTGIWLVGARGSVGTTTVVGAAAVRAGLAPPRRLRECR
jgi:myo-inositol-1-phosphate synthase